VGMGDWGVGIGDWAQPPIPNPQSPIPNPQSPFIEQKIYKLFNLKNIYLYNIDKYYKKLLMII